MALKISTDLKNFIVNNTVKAMAGTMGTGGSSVLRIYSGSQPATADAATNGTLLCTISNICWGTTGTGGTVGATAGTAALNATGYANTASTGGTAGWARLETFGTGFTGSAGTFRIDGDVGTSGTCTFIINTVVFNAGDTVSLSTAPVYLS